MESLWQLGWSYLVIMNLAAFAAYGLDKRKAIRRQRRISEKTLIGLAVLGGSIGALLGMRMFHHKTQKRKFSFGIPCILLLQAAVGIFLFLYR